MPRKNPKTTDKTQDTTKPTLDIQKVDKDQIPKASRRRSGVYAEVDEQLKTLNEHDAIKFKVDTRPTAAGYAKHFKDDYTVTTRTIPDKEGGGIMVYISKKETG